MEAGSRAVPGGVRNWKEAERRASRHLEEQHGSLKEQHVLRP